MKLQNSALYGIRVRRPRWNEFHSSIFLNIIPCSIGIRTPNRNFSTLFFYFDEEISLFFLPFEIFSVKRATKKFYSLEKSLCCFLESALALRLRTNKWVFFQLKFPEKLNFKLILRSTLPFLSNTNKIIKNIFQKIQPFYITLGKFVAKIYTILEALSVQLDYLPSNYSEYLSQVSDKPLCKKWEKLLCDMLFKKSFNSVNDRLIHETLTGRETTSFMIKSIKLNKSKADSES